MPRKKKNESLIQLLVILGGLLALFNAISFIAPSFRIIPEVYYPSMIEIRGLLRGIILLALAIITILTGVNAGEPIPFTAVSLLILAVILILFGSPYGGLLVLIGGIVMAMD